MHLLQPHQRLQHRTNINSGSFLFSQHPHWQIQHSSNNTLLRLTLSHMYCLAIIMSWGNLLWCTLYSDWEVWHATKHLASVSFSGPNIKSGGALSPWGILNLVNGRVRIPSSSLSVNETLRELNIGTNPRCFGVSKMQVRKAWSLQQYHVWSCGTFYHQRPVDEYDHQVVCRLGIPPSALQALTISF